MTSCPIRIAHLSPAYFAPSSYIGGGERYVHYLADALRTVGRFEQCVFATGLEDSLFELGGLPVRVLRNESTLLGEPNAYSAALWRELSGFDLVHIHQSLTLFGAYSTAIARSLGIPLVGTDLGGGEHTLMLNGRCIELMNGVVSISSYAHSLVSNFYSGPHVVLIGPVDTELFHPEPSARRDRKMVLCVSRIMPHKGIDRVIAALPSGLRLTVAGRVYHQQYYELIRNMATGKDVVFIEDATDERLLELYQCSGLFVQASTPKDIYGNMVSKPELMGLTTLEAMACALPVAVSSAGSLPELVTDPRFGRVFTNDSELSAILQDFSSGRWPPAGAGLLARDHVVKAHGMGAIGSSLAEFYDRILANHRASLQ